MQTASVFEINRLRPLGRISTELARRSGVLPLFWSGSGLELCFTGGELHLLLDADFAGQEPWISVEVNGAPLLRTLLAPGTNDICVFRGLTPGPAKRVRLLRESQPMPEDQRERLWISGLRWADGDFLPLPDRTYRLEFVGDSLTSGEGLYGAREETDFAAAWFSSRLAFPRLTADLLNADCRCISQSGWGIRSDWHNDPRHALPDWYDRVCGPASGKVCGALGSQAKHDFAGWKPDAVIVNLGTNDAGAMENPPFPGPDGAPFRQRSDPEGLALLEDAALKFLRDLRRHNPGAALVWAYGMVGDPLRPALSRAVERFRMEDARAWYLPLPEVLPEEMGSRQHPGPVSHRKTAEVLAEFLRTIL